jgi:uncharacterized protein (DUF305 family)
MTKGMHKMPDGSMMSNDGKEMGTMDMGDVMMDMTTKMEGKAGADLEKIFLEEMITHHQGAIDMANLLLGDKSTKSTLKDFANKIISTQKPEIEQMKTWLKNY